MTRRGSIFSVLLISSLAVQGFAASLPKEIQRCKLSDSSLTPCMTTFAQKLLPFLLKGMPEIGIPVLDPMKVPDIHNKDPVLKFNMTNNIITELIPTKIEEFKVDQNKKILYLNQVSSGRMDSDYVADGRILILPVTGVGKSQLTLKEMKYAYKMYYDVVKNKDGKDYWKIMKYNVKYTPAHVQIKLTNLFNGNKELSDTFHKFADENWSEIWNALKKYPMKAITDTIVGHVTTLFSKISVEDMFLP